MKDNMDRMELLREITILNFVKEDLSLYLNTHPMDKDAIAKYNFYVMQSRALRQNYETNFGMLSEHDSSSGCPWQWIDEPWPWEQDANFRL